MTTTTAPVAAPSTDSRTAGLWRTGLVAAVAAAAATTAIAGAALAAGVPVAIEGEQIPPAGFAQLTLVFSVVGILLAKAFGRWASRPRRTFVVTTVALTALSVVPDLAMPGATAATRLVLIVTHLVAAAIVIPAVARRLPIDAGDGVQ
jgi:hypothetical protein